jgi:hypothetical protein
MVNVHKHKITSRNLWETIYGKSVKQTTYGVKPT